MDTRKHIAAEKKRLGSHNCAQAITTTYADFVGLTPEVALNLGGAFAAGMGNMEGTCGALVGAGMILGMACPDRAVAMKRMRSMMQQFHERNGATQCALLKGKGADAPLRACPDCVADAAEFLEQALAED
ncbi:MAG: C_GCAxxG_C_C family protein [Bacteroidaceae bacterium]|nr:C_GCAxxG_C_C family protein [Bacteroidaceae bacterium]